jgi:hypothetical protein
MIQIRCEHVNWIEMRFVDAILNDRKLHEFFEYCDSWPQAYSKVQIYVHSQMLPGRAENVHNLKRTVIIEITALAVWHHFERHLSETAYMGPHYHECLSKYEITGADRSRYYSTYSPSEPTTAVQNENAAEANTQTTEKENTMNETIKQNTPAFETRNYVNGTDARNLSDEQLIDAIKKLEAEIAALATVKSKSKAIAKKGAELEAMLASTVELLDSRV